MLCILTDFSLSGKFSLCCVGPLTEPQALDSFLQLLDQTVTMHNATSFAPSGGASSNTSTVVPSSGPGKTKSGCLVYGLVFVICFVLRLQAVEVGRAP
jgi:hypothetical protein